MAHRFVPILSVWLAICCTVALSARPSPEVWAASVPVYAFGRYEIVLQEGTPFAPSEILGTIRRQTGLPEYPLMIGLDKGRLALHILGPGNRPIQLAVIESRALSRPPASATTFLIARSARESERLMLWIRRAGVPGQATFSIDLRALERLLEGER